MILRHHDPQGAVYVNELGQVVEPGERVEVAGDLAKRLLSTDVWERVDKPHPRAKDEAPTDEAAPSGESEEL